MYPSSEQDDDDPVDDCIKNIVLHDCYHSHLPLDTIQIIQPRTIRACQYITNFGGYCAYLNSCLEDFHFPEQVHANA